MHSLFRKRGAILTGLLALVLAAVTPTLASAKPEPGAKGRGFRMFARPLGAMTINRVYCGLSSTGEVCVDSLNSSTIGGGFWPKGTANQYVFNSGLQIAGIVGSDGGPWANDTTGAFFFDPKGTTQHGEQVQPIYNTQSASDNAFICGIGSFGCNSGTTDPVALAARVPQADDNALIFNPLLQGRTAASQGDVWWVSWDGNPGLLAGRPHPLGVVVEQRGLGWNFPSGNEDIVYFIYTFYNVTSINPADYAGVRPGMREILIQQANTYQQRNEATFGISLPDAGYTITNMFANFAADMDVGDAGQNYASVNVPFALGYTYEHTFSQFAGWSFDDNSIFGPPFFKGTGFVGVKYLKSPEVGGVEVGLSLFSNTTNGGGDLNDPRDVKQLYRYISGTLSTAFGDGACNFNPLNQQICFIRQTSAADVRFFQSSGPLTLAPGEFGSVVVAYLFAAPVATGGTAACPACDIKPGAANIIAGLDDPNIVSLGVNPIDSITGFLDANDVNGDNVLTQNEFTVVPGSLLGKAAVAQAVFDALFLLPFAPDAPDFFLIPGDNQVTVMWRPSPSETAGDPFFSIANQALVAGNPNPLYDPNYREFDVEGYRIYRGRVDAPNSLRLLAQFDYAGTVMTDFAGQVNPVATCAPEIGVTAGCPVVFDPIGPGLPRTNGVDIPLVGNIVQVKLGARQLLATGDAIILDADTIPTGATNLGSCAPSACPVLVDNGVPFAYVDNTVRNNFRYFYSVTAFDINSFQSGPSNLESARVTKPVIPVRPAANYENTAILDAAVYGRDVKQTDITTPGIDPTNGTFTKAMPAPNGWTLALSAFVQQVIAAPGAISVKLDSLTLGDAYGGAPVTYWATVTTAAGSNLLQIPIVQEVDNTPAHFSTSFTAISIDNALASRYGGNGSFTLAGQLDVDLSGNYYTDSYGRGCVNGAPGFAFANTPQTGCDYNGARWFDGPSPTTNETFAHPNACSSQNFVGNNDVTCYTNAGSLTGVENIFEEKSYQTTVNVWRNVEGILGGATRAADYNVYWGAGGVIDSVIDISSNVVVPFNANRLDGSWGILNQTAAQPSAGSFDNRTELTVNDFGCVEPFKSTYGTASGQLGCAAGPTYVLSNTAVPGPIVHWSGAPTNARVTCLTAIPVPAGCGTVAPNNGFAMYMPGHIFMLELTGGQVPAAGTVWSMRDYTGSVRGGGAGCTLCQAGADGPYAFVPRTRTMAAVGAEVRFTFDVINQVNAPVDGNLNNVHTVPDPYYVTSEFEQSTDTKIIKFVNLPQDAVIRIYSSSGVLVNLLEHHSNTFGGSADWSVRNRNNQVVASGVYFYHIEAGNARKVGRFTVVNFAQ